MLQSQVDILLENYKRNIGRQGHILAEIGRLKREIALIELGAADISASVVTGMPRAGAPRDDTQRKALMLAEGELKETKIQREAINRLSRELTRVELDISYVENWLTALNEREKHVISGFIIEGDTWQAVGKSFERTFGHSACETTLRRIKSTALDKIYAIAS